MEKSTTPLISIIVTAYNRTEYLMTALLSALNQTLDRNLFEVILTKNFHNKNIDELAKRESVVLVDDHSEYQGEMLANAIKMSKGEILCFLEDDDYFYQEKLEILSAEYGANKGLGFFRDSLLYVDSEGNPMNRSTGNPINDMVCNPRDMTDKDVSNLLRKRLDFNLSSMSVRRIDLLPFLSTLSNLSIAPDSFMFYVALSSKNYMRFSTRKLTNYRVHLSLTGEFDSYRDLILRTEKIYRRFNKSWSAMLHGLPKGIYSNSLNCHILESDLYIGLASGTQGRRTMLSNSIKYGKCILSMREPVHILQVAVFFCYIISPFLSRMIFFAYKRLRSLA